MNEEKGKGFTTRHVTSDGAVYFFNMALQKSWWADSSMQPPHVLASSVAREQQHPESGRCEVHEPSTEKETKVDSAVEGSSDSDLVGRASLVLLKRQAMTQAKRAQEKAARSGNGQQGVESEYIKTVKQLTEVDKRGDAGL